MKLYLQKLLVKESLTAEEAEAALLKIGNGEVNQSQIAAFLMGIQQKGISVDELIGFRNAMLSLAIHIDLADFDAIDVCGTGGDGKDTFNISTTAAFVVAGAGQPVAKHGNHGVSSAVGSSTVLEYLGVNFTNDADYLKKKMETAGMCYLHAPLFHPAMRFVGPVRKELGIKTFFNILGPLLNPAEVKKQLTGVYSLPVFELYKSLFQRTDARFGILHALDGYDEISLTGDFMLATNKFSADGGEVFSPSALGFATVQQTELYGGGTVEESAEIIKNILSNQGTAAQTAAVVANAGVALSVARDISLEEGVAEAKDSISNGKAFEVLKELVI
ncbi:MAG: anthranilate phosphoribosyltransferase [Spirosomataceae bacterium]|jgi:anthranilate phosphoribosyltransferase